MRPLLVLAVLALAAPAALAVADAPKLADDFESGIGPQWASVVGGVAASTCGATSGSNALLFRTASAERSATTVPLAIAAGDAATFYWRPVFSSGLCPSSESNDDLQVQFSANGGPWTTIADLQPITSVTTSLAVAVPMPPEAVGPSTQLRWRQSTPGGSGDTWFIDDVVVGSGRLVVERIGATETVPAVDQSSPPVDTPAACSLDPCTSPTQETTDPVVLVEPGTCVPPTSPLVCADDGVTVRSQTTPEVPALCTLAGPACLEPVHVPSKQLVDSPQVQVKVGWTAIVLDYDARTDERQPFGPVSQTVDLSPLAEPTTLTFCPETCQLPVPPGVAAEGLILADVVVGTSHHPVAVPISL